MTAQLPLAGIRVLELGHNIMGPVCGMILADLGAEVYKVERTGRGDDTRWLGGFGAGFSTCFNRNKKSLAIELKTEQGRELFLRLVQQVDVLIENFGPGTVDRLGIGYAACSERHPGLVFCSLKGFMPGPYAGRPALDEVVQMMGGLAYMTGPRGRPLRAGSSATDILSGGFGVIGILAALCQRQQTGRGQLVEAALFESVALLMGQHMAAAAITGTPPPPMPERGRTWSVYELFTTADGKQIFIGITSDRHWQRFCAAFAFADWAADARLTTNQGRLDHRELFFPELVRRVQRMSLDALTARLEAAAIPFAPVGRPEDLFTDPHLQDSDGLAATRTPDGRLVPLPKLPLRMDGKRFPLRLQPPAVGEGGQDLLTLAGLSSTDIDALAAAGVITAAPPHP